MHEYRRFIQQQLDERRWTRSDLVRRSGLSRQLIGSILTDGREHLGQMPDNGTLEGLATGFGMPVEVFRTAAARSLVGYIDDGAALTIQLRDVSTDVLLGEVRRRIDEGQSAAANPSTPAGTPTEGRQAKEAGSLKKGQDGFIRDRLAAEDPRVNRGKDGEKREDLG